MQQLSPSPYLSPEERKQLLQPNDWRAAFEILCHWLWIAFAFGLVYFYLHPITVIIALFILGGKQLACAILMHDAGHFTVFKNKKWNDRFGQWLGAYPIFQNVKEYRPYHLEHHLGVGTADDPDLLLTRAYPTSQKSMFRKLFRDFSGQTGIKAFFGIMMIHLGYLEYNLGGKVVRIDQSKRSWQAFFSTFYKKLSGPIIANLVLVLILGIIASPYLYLLWIGAYFTTFQFSLRIRSMAEHSLLEDTLDPIRNTRTTYANFIERILFAPYYVNYHMEHHMMMAVPSYNLPKMHRLLKARGFYEKGILEKNYWRVFKLAIR